MESTANARNSDALPTLPPEGAINKKEIQVKVVVEEETVNVHVVEMVNKDADTSNALTLLFLHGGSFTSQNWVDIKTLEHVASWGYRAVAMDLPGYGKTTEDTFSTLNAEFLTAFIEAMDLRNVVIVSPSMSGQYSLPFMYRESGIRPDRVVGFVPIAPMQIPSYRERYSESQIATLVVYGTRDMMVRTVLDNLTKLPNHEVAPIEDAGHACYMNNPEAFHRSLYQFLKKLESD